MKQPTILSQRSGTILLAVFLLLGLQRKAWAGGDTLKMAKAHYAAGVAHYRQGHYKDALKEFRNSYDLSKKPGLLYNMGQCYERLGDLKKAIEYRRRYLGAMPDAPNRQEVELQIQSLQTRLAATAVQFKGKIPKNALISLDGKPAKVDARGLLHMSPGNHLLRITMKGKEVFRAAVALAQGQQLTIPVDITAPSAGPTLTRPTKKPSYLGVWITLGATGAVLAAATGLGLSALNTANSANDALDKGYLGSYNELKSKAKRLALGADVSFGLAGGLAVTSLVLFLVSRHKASKERAKAQVTPILGPGTVGLATSWSF